MRRRSWSAVALLPVLVLSACSTVEGQPSADPAAPATKLAAALSRVDPAALGENLSFEFGATKELVEVTATDRNWLATQALGAGNLGPLAMVSKETIGIEPLAADWSISVGQPPGRLTLLSGGQDAAKITELIVKGGWKGTGTYTTELNIKDKEYGRFTLAAPKIKPTGSDVVIGGAASDPGLIDPAARPAGPAGLDAAVKCLGDVVFAVGDKSVGGDAVQYSAVGVRYADQKSTSVICLPTGSPEAAKELADRMQRALEEGQSKASRRPWTELLPGAKATVVDGSTVQVTSDTTGNPPNRVFSMLLQRDLPGVN